jgi:predicted glycoside hydrolase/deacetylase ChbG (UPF0249 family)
VNTLLINCDDLGMHPSVNRAIVSLLATGPVSSCSLMPASRHFEDAVARLREAAIGEVGVHLMLGSEYPLLPTGPLCGRGTVPSLVDAEGNFFSGMNALRPRMRLAEVECELRAQIARVKGVGLRVTHLDGHMFFYEEPVAGGVELVDIIRLLAAEEHVPFRHRARRETLFIWDGYESVPSRLAYYSDLMGRYDGGAAELILHPADDLAALATFTKSGPRRYGDFQFFQAPGWSEALSQRGVRVVGWGDVAGG